MATTNPYHNLRYRKPLSIADHEDDNTSQSPESSCGTLTPTSSTISSPVSSPMSMSPPADDQFSLALTSSDELNVPTVLSLLDVTGPTDPIKFLDAVYKLPLSDPANWPLDLEVNEPKHIVVNPLDKDPRLFMSICKIREEKDDFYYYMLRESHAKDGINKEYAAFQTSDFPDITASFVAIAKIGCKTLVVTRFSTSRSPLLTRYELDALMRGSLLQYNLYNTIANYHPNPTFLSTYPSSTASITEVRVWVIRWFEERCHHLKNHPKHCYFVHWDGHAIHNHTPEELAKGLRDMGEVECWWFKDKLVADVVRARDMEKRRSRKSEKPATKEIDFKELATSSELSSGEVCGIVPIVTLVLALFIIFCVYLIGE